MTDPRFPGRPEHPDFWFMSQGVIEQDAQADAGQGFEDVVGRYVDVESVLYAAKQRVLRAQQQNRTVQMLLARLTARDRALLEVSSQTLWLDAFIQGLRFQQLKAAGGPHVGEDPVIAVTVTRSAGDDGALVVMLDTYEHRGQPSRPLRVVLNDEKVFADTGFDHDGGEQTDREAGDVQVQVYANQVQYEETD